MLDDTIEEILSKDKGSDILSFVIRIGYENERFGSEIQNNIDAIHYLEFCKNLETKIEEEKTIKLSNKETIKFIKFLKQSKNSRMKDVYDKDIKDKNIEFISLGYIYNEKVYK